MPTKPLNGSTDAWPRPYGIRRPPPPQPKGEPVTRLLNEPVALGAAIRLSLLAAMAFGLSMTETQMVALMAALEAVLALFTRQTVTPNQLAVERVERAQQAGQPITPTTATTPRP